MSISQPTNLLIVSQLRRFSRRKKSLKNVISLKRFEIEEKLIFQLNIFFFKIFKYRINFDRFNNHTNLLIKRTNRIAQLILI